MPYSFAAFEHLADVGRAPSPAAGAPAGLLPHATTLLSARPAGPGAPRRPGACPTNGLRLSSPSKTIWHCAEACAARHIIVNMPVTDLYLKVELEHDDDEKPQRLADEICRRLTKIYGVRSAEVSNMVSRAEPE